MKAVETIVIQDADGEARIDRWFRRRFPHLSQGQIEKMLRTGQIRVDGARVKANDRVRPGQVVRVPPLPDALPERKTGLSEEDVAFVKSLVLYRDAEVIVLNKPAGLATQGGSKTGRHLDGLLDGLMFDYESRPKLVHRLDKDTSGCLLLARTPRAATELSEKFRSRKATKIYWAVVLGCPRPPEGEIRGWLIKSEGSQDSDREMVRQARHGQEGALFAITDYAAISEAYPRAAWMALKPLTGRTHQLRFHMAEFGHAILGDGKYRCGLEVPGGLSGKLHLHARAIEVPHPVQGLIRVTAPLPPHMLETFDRLGFEQGDAKDPFAAFR
jgi:23S rRNA pseudouridine955/2504/2580 synthase